MKAFNQAAHKECDECLPIPDARGEKESGTIKRITAEMSSQTVVHLPHSHQDVIWTASSLVFVIDISEEENISSEDDDNLEPAKAKFQMGPSVNDIDALVE